MRAMAAHNYFLVPCLAGAITADANGKSADTLGAESVTFVYQFGTTTSGTSGSAQFIFQHSDDDGSTNPYADISGAQTAALGTDANIGNQRHAIAMSRKTTLFKRYVRVRIDITGTASTAATGPQNAGGVLAVGPMSPTLGSSNFNSLTIV